MYAKTRRFAGEHRPELRRKVAGLMITGYLVIGQGIVKAQAMPLPKKYHGGPL